MELNRNHAHLNRISKQTDNYVNASIEERIAFMWELTAELWSLKGNFHAEQRLQRNRATLIKKRG